MQDWDDLRFFLSVAAHGSTLAAASALKTSQSTVFRRIRGLESDLNVKLFERRASGYSLTEAGTVLIPLAQRIADEIYGFYQTASRESRQQLTVIRFSAPDSVLEFMLPTVMAGFREEYPDVRIEIVSSDRQLDLATGEADVAMRANPASVPDLVGRQISEEGAVLAASHEYAARRGIPIDTAEFADHDFINPIGLLAINLGGWFEANVPRSRVLVHPDSVVSTLSATRSGLGIAILPQFIVDRDPALVAAPVALPLKSAQLWILTHQRLRKSPPVQAFMQLVADYVRATTKDPATSATSGPVDDFPV